MAVEDININPMILPSFKLKLHANNTQVGILFGLANFNWHCGDDKEALFSL